MANTLTLPDILSTLGWCLRGNLLLGLEHYLLVFRVLNDPS